MRRKRAFRERKRKFKFTGERTDTKTVGVFTEHGRKYIARQDGSWYPKHTSISVSPSVKMLCDCLVYYGNYHNNDELFLDLTKAWLLIKKPNFNEGIVSRLEESMANVKKDCLIRKKARMKATVKRRNRPRKTFSAIPERIIRARLLRHVRHSSKSAD
jgi:hypothetical protein